MARRNYRNGQATTLAFPVSALDTVIQVNSASSFPTQYPYTLIVEPDGALEEVVEVTNGAGAQLTVTRGVDGTTASAHSAGVQIYHGVSARDYDEANAHVNATSNVHGVSGGLVGAAGDQTIAGVKNFTGALQVAGSPVVSTAGNQTVGGIKTFSSRPQVTGNGDVVTVSGAQTLDSKSFTGPESHAGAETHTGTETHSGTETHNGPVQFNNDVTVASGKRVIAPDTIASVGYSGTVDSNGFITVTHNIGFTPVAGWAVGNNPGSSFAVFWAMDNITSTQCRLRFMNANGGPLNGLGVTGRLFLVRP